MPHKCPERRKEYQRQYRARKKKEKQLAAKATAAPKKKKKLSKAEQKREAVRRYQREYKRKNAAKLKAKAKAYYEANKERISERSAARRRKDHEAYLEYIREYNSRPENKERRKDLLLKKTYGISLDDYNRMLEEVDHSCQICGKHTDEQTKMLAVDHCHDTGAVRGLLCDNCNRGMGLLKDSIEVLESAVKYLKMSKRNGTKDKQRRARANKSL